MLPTLDSRKMHDKLRCFIYYLHYNDIISINSKGISSVATKKSYKQYFQNSSIQNYTSVEAKSQSTFLSIWVIWIYDWKMIRSNTHGSITMVNSQLSRLWHYIGLTNAGSHNYFTLNFSSVKHKDKSSLFYTNILYLALTGAKLFSR